MALVGRRYGREIVLIIMFVLMFSELLPVLGMGNGRSSNDISDHDRGETMRKKTLCLSNSYFTQNIGQVDSEEIVYYSQGGEVYFTPYHVLYRFREIEPIDLNEDDMDDIFVPMRNIPDAFHERGVVLKFSFIGANDVVPEGQERCSWNSNYFKGSDPNEWYTKVPNYGEIVYPGLWDGIDLVYRIREGSVKYDLILHPGSDPTDIRIRIDGAKDLSIDRNGDLVIRTEYWDILDSGLYSYYRNNFNDPIPCQFIPTSKNEYTFGLGMYDVKKCIVIDPTLAFSTFLGGSSMDYGTHTIDPHGNAYITGNTLDDTTDYPTTPGAYDTSHNGDYDVFVTKLSSNGSSLIYSTFLGGSNYDSGLGISVDSGENAYITGGTADGTMDYPTTPGAFDTSHNGDNDVFVTKLNSTGSSLIYSTFIGGSDWDLGSSIDIDPIGNAYITGSTVSAAITAYPTTSGAFDNSTNGSIDVFVTKLNPAGSSLIYSTFIGGSFYEMGQCITVDPSGNAYITGWTYDDSNDFPITPGAYDTIWNGQFDVFVTKLSSTGSSLIYSTLLGGSQDDMGISIAVDPGGCAYITGETTDARVDYPITSGSYGTSHNGNSDVFVTKLSSTGSSLVYSTFIGGSNDDMGTSITVDPEGNAYITGETQEGTTDYPTTPGAFDTSHNGDFDVFVTELNSTGSSLIYSTLLGGSANDVGLSIMIGPANYVYISGYTFDDTTDYPTTPGAYDTSHNGLVDVFVSKFLLDGNSPIFGKDKTPLKASTGDPFSFIIPVSDDRSGIDQVCVEYWFGMGMKQNVSMTNSSLESDYSLSTEIPTDSISSLFYIFHASDKVGNWARTIERNVTIKDNDGPMFGVDTTDLSGTTGEPFCFTIDVTDNIDIPAVSVEFWYGEGSHKNLMMAGSGSTYSVLITIPSSSMEILNYKFHAGDSTGNWAHTSDKIVTIIDNDRPIFGTDSTPGSGTTGDPLMFNISASDNIHITNVYVEYWYGSGFHSNMSMSGDGRYTLEVTNPSDSTDPLNYIFHSRDGQGNWNWTKARSLSIIDNDKPSIEEDETPRSGSPGNSLTFKVNVTDNIGVTGVFVEYWYGTGSPKNSSMQGTGTYTLSINLRSERIEDLSYNISAKDKAGNWVRSSVRSVIIKDIEVPWFGSDSTPEEGFTGDPFMFNIESSDSIGVISVFVEYWYGIGVHKNISMSGSGPYTREITIPSKSIEALHYRFHSVDATGNWAHTIEKIIMIEDNDKPSINDKSTGSPTTGDEYRFIIEVRDNIRLIYMKLEYWYDLGTPVVVDLDLENKDQYIGSIVVPASGVVALHYRGVAIDYSNNSETMDRELSIQDNDDPILESDSSPKKGKAGEDYTFHVVVSDNDEISRVEVEYWFGDGEHKIGVLDDNGKYTFKLPGSGGTFSYRFIIEDASGNVLTTGTNEVQVNDNRDIIIWMVITLLFIIMVIAGIGIFLYIKWKNKRNEEKA